MNILFSLFLIILFLPILIVRIVNNSTHTQTIDRIFMILLFLVVSLFTLFPLNTVQPLASFLGIGRGSDLIFYTYIAVSLVLFDFQYRKLKLLERRQIKLMQELIYAKKSKA